MRRGRAVTRGYKVEVFVPLRDDGGELYPDDLWEWYLKVRVGFFDGLVLQGSVVEPSWSEGITPTHRFFRLEVRSERSLRSIETFVSELRRRLGRTAVYMKAEPMNLEEEPG
jgi:hypothetical protein